VQQQLRERLVRELGQPLFDRVHAYLLTLQSEDDVAAGAGDMQQELESLASGRRSLREHVGGYGGGKGYGWLRRRSGGPTADLE
jgi:hypothetical protein